MMNFTELIHEETKTPSSPGPDAQHCSERRTYLPLPYDCDIHRLLSSADPYLLQRDDQCTKLSRAPTYYVLISTPLSK